jgi:hypothetical protein
LHVCCGLGFRWLHGRGTWSGRAAARPRAGHRIKIKPYCPRFPPNRTLCLKFAPAAVWPREAVRALSGQSKGSCRGLWPSGGTAGDRGRPQPKPRGGNAAEMAVSKTTAPDRTLCLKFAPAAVWPREVVRALSGQPKGSCRGLRPSGGTAGDRARRGRPQPKLRDRIRITAVARPDFSLSKALVLSIPYCA